MNRKKFLNNALLSSALFTLPATAHGNNNKPSAIPAGEVKITDVKGYYFKKAHFIKVETDAGINGWGESDGANKSFANQYIRKQLRQYIVGRDPFDSEGIWHEAYLKGIESGIGGIHPGVLSGVDNALWDLKGKLVNLPARKLLGANGKEKIQVYGSYGRDKGSYNYMTPKEMADIAVDFVSQGYKSVKARMQIRQENINPFPDDIFECVKEIRNAIGDKIQLMVDFNNGYSPANAIMMGKKLYEHFNIAALEEPVFQQDYTGLREVVDAMDCPVMAGEHEYNKWMMKDLITISNVDIINADVIKCGITECRKTASMAHAFGKQIMVHNAKPTLATAASLQLLGSIPNGATFQEYAGKRLPGYAQLYELFDNYFEFEDGFLSLPNEPGLGLLVNEKAMDRLGKTD
ncbi:MAG: mandelate racemase/muconate lactonizing enzyme family protein [Cyclobacteriaceae bacterium]|nr:mandelate racemase/muconate lactonizing enzyme family protein [Cyclobacteriaceae bacterium]